MHDHLDLDLRTRSSPIAVTSPDAAPTKRRDEVFASARIASARNRPNISSTSLVAAPVANRRARRRRRRRASRGARASTSQRDMPRDAAADALAGQVAVVSGASRGIGRACALALARRGVNVVVAAKSATESATLPGTVHGVARECDAVATRGARAMGCVVNLLDEASILACVARAKARYGRIDVLVNNASALWWQDIEDTPTKKYDLIQGVNARGAFVLTRACLREMRAGGRGGRVISMGPPLPKSYKEYETKTAYYMSKCGMSMVALGAAAEGEKYGVTGNALWPATIVESLASENFELGSRDNWRKADILADCVVELCCDAHTTGQTLIDDEYLQTRGAKFPEDFVKYRCNPDVEPKRLLAPGSESAGWDVRRGDVKKLSKDKARSRL